MNYIESLDVSYMSGVGQNPRWEFYYAVAIDSRFYNNLSGIAGVIGVGYYALVGFDYQTDLGWYSR